MSLLNTRLLEARLSSPTMSDWTATPKVAGAFDAFVQGNMAPNSIVTGDLYNRARAVVGRDLKIPALGPDSVTVQTTRPVTIADDENDGQLVTLVFGIAGFGFTVREGLHLNNEHTLQADFNRKLLKGINAVTVSVDTAAAAALDTNKNQIWAEALGRTTTGNVVEYPLADQDEVYGEMSTIMEAHDFNSTPYSVVTNAGGKNLINRMKEHAVYNDQNKTIQFADKNFHFSNRVTNAALKKATGYIVDSGALGYVRRSEPDSILQTVLPDGTTWGEATLPILNQTFDTYMYWSRGDNSAIAGDASAHYTRGAIAHYGFSLEYALVTAYNSDLATYSNPIMKWQVATT